MTPQARNVSRAVRQSTQSSLRFRLTAAFVGVAAAAIAIVGTSLLYTISANLEAETRDRLKSDTQTTLVTLQAYLINARSDVTFLSQLPALKHYLSAEGRTDPATLAAARADIEAAFLALAQARQIYDQVRYIDSTGQEVARVNAAHEGDYEIVPANELRNKAKRPYFQGAIGLPPGGVYVSTLELNVENGQIEIPHKPVLRYATPIYFDGQIRGIVVTNVLAERFLASLGQGDSPAFLVDADGYYLYHPDEAKRWGRDLGTGLTVAQDFPGLAAQLFSGTTSVVNTDGHLFAFSPVVLPNQDTPRWYLVSFIPEAKATTAATGALAPGLGLLAGVLAVTLVVASLVVRTVTAPLQDLTLAAEKMAEGDLNVEAPVRSVDEIGALARAFNTLAASLRELIGSFEARVAERTTQLEAANRELKTEIAARRQAEEAQQASAAQFRTLFEASPEAIILIEPRGSWSIVDCNESACRMNGYTREELIGQSIDLLNLTPGDDAEGADYLERVRATGVLHLETFHRRKDGTLFPVEVSTSLIALGERELLLGIDRDITDRKQAEEAWRLSEERFRFVSYATNDAVWDLDVRSGQLWWNIGVSALFGYRPEEVGADRAWWEAQIHPDDRAKVLASFQDTLAIGGQFWSKEYRYRRADGAYAYVFDRGYVIYDEQGRPLRVIGAMADLTKRKQAEAALQESERKLRLIASNVSDVIFAYDMKGGLIYVNPAVEVLTGYKVEELIQKQYINWAYAEDEAKVARLWADLFAGRDNLTEEFRIVTKDGQVKWCLSACGATRDEAGRQIGVQITVRDITERKRTEEALREAEEKYRVMVEQLPAITYTVTFDQVNRTTYISPQVEPMLGFSPEEWLADPELWIRQIHPDDREPMLAEIRRKDESGEPLDVEYRAKTRDGHTRWLRNRSILIRDDDGQPRYSHGIMFDVTERKQAEAALQEANEKLTLGLRELEQRNREIALLNKMGELLQSCAGTDEAYDVINTLARQLFPEEAGALCIIAAAGNLVEVVTQWGEAPFSNTVFAPEDCRALQHGHAHLVEPGGASSTCRHIAKTIALAHLCIPLIAQGEALGILYLCRSPETGAVFSEAWQQLAQAVADNVALALANLRLRETLRNQSIRDALTSLFNRRYMEESLDRELHRAAREQYAVGVIMVDLDHFKNFNDTFGHAAGDALLSELGLFLREHIRGGDIACRYGGEEFVLILPEASLEIARQRAELLRQEIKHLHVQYEGQPLGTITMSLGVAAFPEHGVTGGALLRAADAALYRAKHEGRDRVMAPA